MAAGQPCVAQETGHFVVTGLKVGERFGRVGFLRGVFVSRRGELRAPIGHLLRELELLEPLRARLAAGMPAYGSCAGMILLATEITDAGVPGREALPLGGIDMTVRRNAFGRQVDSFEGDIEFDGLEGAMHAVFIRAPWVERVGPSVEVLARAAGHPVAVRQGRTLATSFHPEMTGDRRVHRLFVDSL